MNRNVISVKTKTYLRTFGFTFLAVFIAILFVYVLRINHKAPRKGPEIPSFVNAQSQLVLTKMKQLNNVSKHTKNVSSVINSESFKVAYSFSLPLDWKFWYFQDPHAFGKQSLTDGNCLIMTSNHDRMPLWEAFAHGKMMLLEDHVPFYSEGIAEIEVSKIPAVVMKVRLKEVGPVKQSDLFFHSVLFVIDNTLTITVRACSKISEDDFLRWLRSVRFNLVKS